MTDQAFGLVRIARPALAGGVHPLRPGDEAYVELSEWKQAGNRGTIVTLYRAANSGSVLGRVPGETVTEWYEYTPPVPDREHVTELNPAGAGKLRAWLEHPSGGLSMGRVTFEAVSGGGILVRTAPYAGPASVVRVGRIDGDPGAVTEPPGSAG